MNKTNHLLFGILIYLVFTKLNFLDFKIIGIIILLIASLLPDIDIITSTFGNKIKIIAFAFKHRGFFHSLLFGILMIIILLYANFYYFEFMIGYFSHLILDMTTYKGIQFFWPLNFKFKGFIKTNNTINRILSLGLFLINILFILFFMIL
jgi:inner membrane protein